MIAPPAGAGAATTCEAGAILLLLQQGDSAYPSGGFAFSWGIEGLAADGFIRDGAGLNAAVAEHLEMRWQVMDRILLRRAWAGLCGEDWRAALARQDAECEALTPVAEMREGSRRAGRALLGIAARRFPGGRAALWRGEAPHGHLPVAQALAWREAGLDLAGAELLSGWTLATGLVSAALRLGLVGHVDAQASLDAARSRLSQLLADEPAPDAELWSFTPLIDIAVARGPARALRMFTT